MGSWPSYMIEVNNLRSNAGIRAFRGQVTGRGTADARMLAVKKIPLWLPGDLETGVGQACCCVVLCKGYVQCADIPGVRAEGLAGLDVLHEGGGVCSVRPSEEVLRVGWGCTGLHRMDLRNTGKLRAVEQ